LLPVAIPHTSARLARGIRAGRWVFASGQAATDYVNGLAPDVAQAERPLNGESRYKREARRIYDNVKEVLAEVGADIPDVVRVDQYYTTERAMHPYHEVRHEVFGKRTPPLDIEPASEVFAHRPDHRDPGHGGRSRLRHQGQARDVQAELRHLAGLGLQSRAQCRRFPLRAGTDRRSA
jgi:enamine deaminase RidA (YjgF/YER057c/UK114 family)